ncbi:MAG TPA: choice-of-anchor tandem repeat GloVer-containing protein [Rhizomicrobium sp.]|nr:choice-of-anchor tandem repeat GloVer-containing protein [Rhizomicrobium sp.]
MTRFLLLTLTAVLAFSSNASAKFKVLYSLADGEWTGSSLSMDSNGDLYGTTPYGGPDGDGTVFRLSRDGVFTALYSFKGQPDDGAFPHAGVIVDSAGNLYGTTESGGIGRTGGGIVFRISSTGREKVLDYFDEANGLGGAPAADLIRDASGDFYGTSRGQADLSDDHGTVFRLDRKGRNMQVLYAFTGEKDGASPRGGLVLDNAGNLYGTTSTGGQFKYGTLFKLSPDGKKKKLHEFNGGDGMSPNGVTADSFGNLYGTTNLGGSANCFFGCGTVFKVAPDGTFAVLYRFQGHAAGDGADPQAEPVVDDSGTLWGTTAAGGAGDNGTIYEITPDGVETVVHSFGNRNGISPGGRLLRDKSGALYGTASFGGDFGQGTIFEFKP